MVKKENNILIDNDIDNDEYVEISDEELINFIYTIPNFIYNNYVIGRLYNMDLTKLLR